MEERVEYLLTSGRLDTHSLADLGGLFLGEDGEKVARAMLKVAEKRHPHIQAVCYYSKDRSQMMISRGAIDPTPVASSSLPQKNRAAYWALEFCTGANDLIDPEATAKVSINRHNLMRDPLQSVWRLRGLASGQKVEFVVSHEDRIVIEGELKRALGITVGETLELHHIILYVFLVEQARLKKRHAQIV